MNIKSVVAFVKAGYTPGEIAKLEDPEKTLDLLNAGIKKEDVSEWLGLLDEPEEQEEQQPDETEKQNGQNADDTKEPGYAEEQQSETDYKKLYTDLLKKQQEQNVNRDMSGNNKEKTNDEKLQDIVRKFM